MDVCFFLINMTQVEPIFVEDATIDTTTADKKRPHELNNTANKRAHTIEASYPNNSSNAGEYHWCLHGQDKVRAARKEGKVYSNEPFPKKYFICTEKKKGGKCKAKKTVHSLPDGDVIEFKGTHDHPPLSNPKIDPKIKQKVIEQLSVGAKPAMIHSKMVNDAEGPITSRTVPKKQQIYNWQHQMTMAQLPTGIDC